jgi:hypothetical protein
MDGAGLATGCRHNFLSCRKTKVFHFCKGFEFREVDFSICSDVSEKIIGFLGLLPEEHRLNASFELDAPDSRSLFRSVNWCVFIECIFNPFLPKEIEQSSCFFFQDLHAHPSIKVREEVSCRPIVRIELAEINFGIKEIMEIYDQKIWIWILSRIKNNLRSICFPHFHSLCH